MNPEIEKKYQRLRSFFFGLCVIAAALLLLSGFTNMYKSKAAASWPVHTGVVDQGLQRGISSGYFGGRFLIYRYQIDGKEYTGSRIGFGISRPQQPLENGARVRVYVNPNDVSTAVLEVGVASSHLVALLFSAGFFWMGWVIWHRTS